MSTRRVEPMALDWATLHWPGGRFDTARRTATPAVEGTIGLADHLVLVTVEGGAEHLEVADDSGHRFAGADFAGAVSFVPAGTTRRLAMKGVASRWASIALSDSFLVEWAGAAPLPGRAFTNATDGFTFQLAREITRTLRDERPVGAAYCEAMAFALAEHIRRRHGEPFVAARPHALPEWRLRRVAELVEAELASDVSIATLARAVGLSAGQFHRAFKQTTGKTPLGYLNERRVARAAEIIQAERVSITEVALRVGFDSPTHFARLFRRIMGVGPSDYARAMRAR